MTDVMVREVALAPAGTERTDARLAVLARSLSQANPHHPGANGITVKSPWPSDYSA